MFPFSHALGGIAALRLLSAIWPDVFGMKPLFLGLAVLFALLPDSDMLWADTLSAHHASLLHTPVFWIIISIGGALIGQIAAPWTLPLAALLLVQTLLHLCLDALVSRTSGIRLLYPFTDAFYTLFNTDPERGNFSLRGPEKTAYRAYITHYFSDKTRVLIEALVNVAGILGLLI